MRRSALVVLIIILVATIAPAQQQQPYFYHNRADGSEAMFNPLSLLLNGSYDIIQLDGHPRNIFDFPYRASTRNVWDNIRNPFGPIARYGWGTFIENEVFPIHLTRKGAQWWPNYQLHLIGGGMTYTNLREWYGLHNIPSPTIFSLATVASYHFLNEMVENGAYTGDNVDPIADIWIFDAGGIVLFSFDNINRFFSEDLNLADWSLQPSFNPSTMSLQNNGQYFSIKWKVPFTERWHLFYYCGMNGLTGLSYKMEDGSAISAAAGLRAKNIVMVDAATNQQTMDLVWNGGVFYDRENSLMASLTVSGLTDNMVSLNIYPGIITIGWFSPGLWGTLRKDGSILLGFTTVWMPGVTGQVR